MRKSFTKRFRITRNGKQLKRRPAIGHNRAGKSSKRKNTKKVKHFLVLKNI